MQWVNGKEKTAGITVSAVRFAWKHSIFLTVFTIRNGRRVFSVPVRRSAVLQPIPFVEIGVAIN
jgi:hypothetical protein